MWLVFAVAFVGVVLWLRSKNNARVDVLKRVSPMQNRKRVCVIGGGIAGSGCAWALKQSGFDVTLFEKKATVGGNANTHDFMVSNGSTVRSGLSVLAWPHELFRLYTALLQRLGIQTENVELPFLVQVSPSDGDAPFFSVNHASTEKSSCVHPMFKEDMDRWKSMLSMIVKVTSFFAGSEDTLYKFSFLNPFNLIPLRTLCRLRGISDSFWIRVIIPIYSSTFLTCQLDAIPSVIAPVMHRIIPLDECPVLRTWSQEGSSQVFQRMLQGVNVQMDCPIVHVHLPPSSSSSHGGGGGGVRVTTSSQQHHFFDQIVFACDARTVSQLISSDTLLPRWHRWLLSSFPYVDDDGAENGAAFLDGAIHRQGRPPFIPQMSLPLAPVCSNVVHVDETLPSTTQRVINTFLLSSWVPHVRRMLPNTTFQFATDDATLPSNKYDRVERPFLVTYGSVPVVEEALRTPGAVAVSFRRAHPHLSLRSLALGFLLRWAQGAAGGRVWYCGSFTTPGNGHDLSFASGLSVAHALGAAFPFSSDPLLCNEFIRVKSLLGL